MQAVTVVVIDDHPIFRQGVVDALSMEVDLRVVGQASGGREGLELIRRLQPGVAVVDVNMPGMSGPELTRQALQEGLATRILLLSGYADAAAQQRARQAGAAGFCTKEIDPERLARLIRALARPGALTGGAAIGQPAPGAEDERSRQPGLPAAETLQAGAAEAGSLSGREKEVLLCLARGLSNKEIAKQLGISQQTVKNHVTAVLRKINVADRTQAAILALTRGWVSTPR